MKNEEWLAVRASIVLTSRVAITSLTSLTPRKNNIIMKKEYKKPTTEVVKMQQVQMLCLSDPKTLEGTPGDYFDLG